MRQHADLWRAPEKSDGKTSRPSLFTLRAQRAAPSSLLSANPLLLPPPHHIPDTSSTSICLVFRHLIHHRSARLRLSIGWVIYGDHAASNELLVLSRRRRNYITSKYACISHEDNREYSRAGGSAGLAWIKRRLRRLFESTVKPDPWLFCSFSYYWPNIPAHRTFKKEVNRRAKRQIEQLHYVLAAAERFGGGEVIEPPRSLSRASSRRSLPEFVYPDTIQQRVSRLVILHEEAEDGNAMPDLTRPVSLVSRAVDNLIKSCTDRLIKCLN
ncbi:hypothetical protein ANCCEY_03124 [Ancylostoma ceylanicum]|uniref:Uncharacterized protein n=1 Tax=Ancylostoma ceylanicum TaxID=53326 RepID=A0A0D6M5U5_9BILA|nr:hypothetical protein ANCCEY_03124 [Ancylostoma ceylanicum]